MAKGLNIAFFGSSLVSAYWNGTATYYRGLVRALSKLGHRVTFYEPDAYGRQHHRDLADPAWARVSVYCAEGYSGVFHSLEEASTADVIIKASDVGVYDALLAEAVLEIRKPEAIVAFLDVDAPATLDRVRRDPSDPFISLIPAYDLIFTNGGGIPVVSEYMALGCRECVPIHNALDSSSHHSVPPDPRFAAELAFLGNRRPDREARADEFFFGAAAALPTRRFILGGSGWQTRPLPANVDYLGHISSRDHNGFNSSARAVLNVCREGTARWGYCPPGRLFEAAGAGACLITDAWAGLEQFLEPDREILVAHDAAEVAEHLRALSSARARAIGQAALRRLRGEHTFEHRAAQLTRALEGCGLGREVAV